MPDQPVIVVDNAAAAERVAATRAAARRRRNLRVVGVGLLVYGLIGIIIFVAIAVGLKAPLDRAQQLATSLEEQRQEVIASLDQAEITIRGMSDAVGRMDASLAEVKTAIDRSAGIAHGVATSMYGLRDATGLSILGAQPLIGLADSFDTSGRNLDLLGDDIANIGTALDANRQDATLTGDNLAGLADSVGDLTASMREAPDLDVSTRTLDAVELAVYAVTAWLVLLAGGCVAAGAYLLSISRVPRELG
jgi:hypothetical protein